MVCEVSSEKLALLKQVRDMRQQMAKRSLERYYYDPAAFAHDCIDWPRGGGLVDFQYEGLEALVEHHRVSVRSLHGVGKTTLESTALLWFTVTRDAMCPEIFGDWKCVTTAGAWNQLENYLWPEIHKWARCLRWDKLLRDPFKNTELLKITMQLTYGRASSVSPANTAFLEGAHADSIFFVMDESKSIIIPTWDAAEGAFSTEGQDGKEVFVLSASTPGEPIGRFYEIQSKKVGYEDWYTMHIGLDRALSAGRVSAKWAEQRKLQWGPNSALYANRVLGEFHSSDEDAVIPLSWIEAAIERWKDSECLYRDDDEVPRPPLSCVSVDVARYGEDQSAIAVICGSRVEEIRRFFHEAGPQIVGRVGGIVGGPENTHVRIVVDTDGLGANVTDPLRELDYEVVAFHGGYATDRKDRSGELGFCLTGDATVVPHGSLLGSFEMRYDGPLFRVKMASGDQFTATANHHVLTPSGRWQAVKSLRPDDYLASPVPSQRTGFGHPGPEHMPTRISQLHSATRLVVGGQRVRRGHMDFYGDRSVGDVDIVGPTRHLCVDSETVHQPDQVSLQRLLAAFGDIGRSGGPLQYRATQPSPHRRQHQETLIPGDIQVVPCTSGYLLATSEGIGFGIGAQNDPGGTDGASDDALGHLMLIGQRFDRGSRQVGVHDIGWDQGTPQYLSLGDGASNYALLCKHSSEHIPGDPYGLAQASLRLPADVPLDQVLDIEIVSPNRHGTPVYTLATSAGRYQTVSVVHKNCGWRSAAWWHMREILDPHPCPCPGPDYCAEHGSRVELPDDDQLLGDLAAPRQKRITSKSLIEIEPKVDTKKRLGRSPDSGDAVVMGFWPGQRARRKRRMVAAGRLGSAVDLG